MIFPGVYQENKGISILITFLVWIRTKRGKEIEADSANSTQYAYLDSNLLASHMEWLICFSTGIWVMLFSSNLDTNGVKSLAITV